MIPINNVEELINYLKASYDNDQIFFKELAIRMKESRNVVLPANWTPGDGVLPSEPLPNIVNSCPDLSREDMLAYILQKIIAHNHKEQFGQDLLNLPSIEEIKQSFTKSYHSDVYDS